MSKGIKIGLIVLLLLIAVVVIYFLTRKAAGTGNKYASADSLAKAKSGQYGAYTDSPSASDYNSFYGKAIALDGSAYGGGTIVGEIFSRAWFKGMNIALNGSNFETFRSDIEKYVANTALRKPHWDIAQGSFLTTTTA